MASYFSRNTVAFILLSVFLTVINGKNTTKIQPLAKDISLIYGENENGKLFCRFATGADLRASEGLVEKNCFDKFKDMNMAQILPGGNVTFPFLKFDVTKGYLPACKKLNIPNGILGECNPQGLKIPLVHTVCTYRCAPGFIATSNNVTCSLMGPENNVSFQWLKDSDFFDPENMESEYCKPLMIPNGKLGVCSKDSKQTQLNCNFSCDPDCIATISTEIFHFDIKNFSSFQTSNVKELCIRDPSVEPLSKKGGTLMMPVAVSVSVAVVIIITILIIALPCTRRKFEQECKVNLPTANEEPPNVHPEIDPLLPNPVPALPHDQGLGNEGYPELPNYDYGGHFFNQNRDDQKKVNKDKRITEDPDFKEILKDFDDSLNYDSILQETQQKSSECACGADLEAGGADLEAALPSDVTAGSLSSFDLESIISKKEDNLMCSEDVRFLLDSTSIMYRLKLLGELEVIEGRRREQALVGYVLRNKEALHFPTENSIKLQEETFKNKVDEKVSEYFLKLMSAHGHKIGMMLEYFADVGASNVIEVVLEVHKGCPFCEKFRK